MPPSFAFLRLYSYDVFVPRSRYFTRISFGATWKIAEPTPTERVLMMDVDTALALFLSLFELEERK